VVGAVVIVVVVVVVAGAAVLATLELWEPEPHAPKIAADPTVAIASDQRRALIAIGTTLGVAAEIRQPQALKPVADGHVQLRELARPDQDAHRDQHCPAGADDKRIVALDDRER